MKRDGIIDRMNIGKRETEAWLSKMCQKVICTCVSVSPTLTEQLRDNKWLGKFQIPLSLIEPETSSFLIFLTLSFPGRNLKVILGLFLSITSSLYHHLTLLLSF